jgi:hypothetical protein
MSDDTCKVLEGTSAGAVQCTQPASATVTNASATYRACIRHAKMIESTDVLSTVNWD